MNLRKLTGNAIKHAWPRAMRYIVYCRDLGAPFPDVPNPLGVRIERLDGPAVRQAAVEVAAYGRLRTLFRRARVLGWQAYVARLGGRIVGATFIGRGYIRCHVLRVHRLSDQERYSAMTFVLPGFRGHKLFQLLKVESYLDQRAAGVQRIYNMVLQSNAPSLRVHRNLGARVQFGVFAVVWMRLNIFFRRVQPPADGSVFSWIGPAGR